MRYLQRSSPTGLGRHQDAPRPSAARVPSGQDLEGVARPVPRASTELPGRTPWGT